MLDRAEGVKPIIAEAVVKGYHKCSFDVRVRDGFIVKKKKGEKGPGN